MERRNEVIAKTEGTIIEALNSSHREKGMRIGGQSLMRERTARTLAQTIKAIEIVHRLAVTRERIGKRGVLYEDVELFANQRASDSAIEKVVSLIRIPRDDLGIFAAARGHLFGDVSIKMKDGSEISAAGSPWPIRGDFSVSVSEVSTKATVVIAIEKFSAFHRIVDSRTAWQQSEIGRQSICVTGGGYPDKATKDLFSVLCRMGIRAVGIVDFDPDGIEILVQYRQAAGPSSIDWKSVRCSEVARLPEKAVLPLSERDRRKSESLLMRCPEESWRPEIEWMLKTGRKAEIEATRWLENLTSH